MGGRPGTADRARALTTSERRVAALVAGGASNAEAAAALFVNRKTIETHLSSVYRKLGLRSRSELARAWALAAVGESPLVPPVLRALTDDPMVGRVEERATLLAGWRSGGQHAAVVYGEPGIGKTRLCAWIAEQAVAEGVPVAYGRCREHPVHSLEAFDELLSPLVEANPALLDQLGATHRFALADVLSTPLVPVGQVEAVSGDLRRLRLADAIARLLDAAASRDGLIVIVEDLHWAADSMLPVLRWILTGPVRARALTVVTFRETSPSMALDSFLDDVSRHVASDTIRLGPLGVGEVGELVDAHLGRGHTQLARAVCTAVGGRPFFVLQALRVLSPDVDPAVLSEPARLVELVPEQARGSLVRRLGGLPEETRSILVDGAVCGDDFDAVTVAVARDTATRVVMDALVPAVNERLVVDDPETAGRFRFEHALVRHAVLDGVPRTRRCLAHARICEAIEATNPSDLDGLSLHAFEGMPIVARSVAVDWAQRAADRAVARQDHEAAASHLQRVLDARLAADEPDLAASFSAAVDLTRQAGLCADVRTMKSAGLVAADVARRLGDRRRLGEVAAARGQLMMLGEDDADQFGLIDEALVAAEDEATRLRLVALAARLTASSGRAAGADQTFGGVAAARRAGSDEVLATALLGRCWRLGGSPGESRLLLVTATALVEVTERLGDDARLAIAHAMVAWAHQIAGRHDALAAAWNQVEVYAEKVCLVPQLVAMPGRHAFLALAAGRLDEAAAYLNRPDGPFRVQEDVSAIRELLRLFIDLEKGDVSDVSFADRIADTVLAPTVPALRAWVRASAGDIAAAGDQFERLAADDFAALPRNIAWRGTLQMLTDVCVGLEDTRRAGVLYRLAIPYRGQSSNIFTYVALSSMDRCLGQLAGLVGDVEAADEHFAAALDSDRRAGAHLWEAHTTLAWAAAAVAAGRADQALMLGAEAARLGDRLGLPRVARQASALIATL